MADLTYISLFAGVDALGLGFELAFPEARCIGRCEIEVAASEIMAARIAEGSLAEAPQWSDIRTFPSAMYCGRARAVVAGFPCPDYSVAGKRAGRIGKHGQLWDYLRDTIRDVGPELVLLENVPGILVCHESEEPGHVLPAGLWFVLGDLADMGFDAEWGCVSASDAGAKHKRNRWFILARRMGNPDKPRLEGRDQCRCGLPNERAAGAAGVAGFLADYDIAGCGNERFRGLFNRERKVCRGDLERCDQDMAIPIFAPGPSEQECWADLLVRHPELRPALAQAEIEQLVHGLDDGLASTLAGSRTDQLRCAGNGVVALQAAYAARVLAERVGLTQSAEKMLPLGLLSSNNETNRNHRPASGVGRRRAG